MAQPFGWSWFSERSGVPPLPSVRVFQSLEPALVVEEADPAQYLRFDVLPPETQSRWLSGAGVTRISG